MGYFASMGLRVLPLAALAGLLPFIATAAPAAGPALQPAAASLGPATRFAGGRSAHFMVSARIIRQSARVGAAYGPAALGMVARATNVSAADGRAVPALVYDFE